MEPQLTARIDSQNGVASIALTGALDVSTVEILEHHLAPFEDDGVAAIMVDLRSLEFTDSNGILAFQHAKDRITSGGRRLILVGARQPVRRVFGFTGTESLLDDREAAAVLDRFTGGRARREGRPEIADVDV